MNPLFPLLAASLLLLLPVTLPAQSQPTSAQFGRFGRFNEDGLLTLNVSPHGCAAPPTNTPFQVTFGEGKAQARVERLDTTGKVLRLVNGGEDEPMRLRYTLLYPGWGATYGRRMCLRFTDNKNNPIPIDVTPLFWKQGGGDQNGLLLRREDQPSVALLIAFRPGFRPNTPSLHGMRGQAELILKAQEAIGDVRFVTPLGLRELPSNLTTEQTEQLYRECQRWASIPLPTRLSSTLRLAPNGRSVTFTETFAPPNAGVAIAPVPPVLAFAQAQGYPATIRGEPVSTPCRTKWGDFAYVPGSTLRYTLPVPPLDERGYVRPIRAEEETQNRERLLNELVGHLGGEWASNAVDLGYAGMANAQMAWTYLSPQRRREVQSAWNCYLPLAFTLPPDSPLLAFTTAAHEQAATAKGKPPRPWKTETEPFTGQSYLWTYFIDGPNHRRYDLDWGNALPLYGLYKYAEYTGDWKFVRAHWKDVRRVARYFDLGDDWAWLTIVNADHGYSTGTGDPMAATFCGMLACLKMARALGDKAAEQHFAGRVSRIAVPTVARFWYTGWARKAGLIGPKSVVLGFHETEGYTRARLGADDPWDTTNVLSGDGVLPELYAALQAFGGNALADYEVEYARSFPDWYRGDVMYPFATTYKGNSIYVTFPHIYARALLGEPTQTLWNYVAGAQSNRNNGWIGPNVIAELLSRQSPLLLTEWQPAAYRDGSVSPDGKQAQLTFHLDQPTRWTLSARVQNGFTPVAVTQNGRSIPFQYRAKRLTVSLRAQGDVHLKITLSSSAFP